MDVRDSEPIRVLVVDDEAAVREAYQELLGGSAGGASEAEELRRRLFAKSDARTAPSRTGRAFDVETADGAEAGVEALRRKIEEGCTFDVVFLDMRMPPGPDGAWAAAQMRALDPGVDIVIATAYSDTDPRELSERIPPADKLFYLQKPFHAHEVRQLAIALGGKARAEAQMLRLAYYDSLTGLANRVLVRNRIEEAIDATKEAGSGFAALFIDLDNFKRINDTLGHTAGDEVLKTTADRLQEVVEETGAVELARIGGDDFVLVLPRVSDARQAADVARRISRVLSDPVQIGGHDLYMSPSIGIATCPEDGADVETFLRNADLAMHFAKRSGGDTYRHYDSEMNASELKSLSVETLLRGAVERGELSLAYQPQIDLATGAVSGMEALLRWNNPELGSVPPLEYIPLAEDCGLIHPIGQWVLRSACLQAAGWIDAGLSLERIAVNVSAVQLDDAEFTDRVVEALEASGLAPGSLELEITETALVDNLESARDKLTELKSLGVQIAIDDFGTGYSNMAQLKHLAIDRVKIDRSFVTDVDRGPRDRSITAAIISMAHGMGLRVTAEGVEDEGQMEILESQKCDEIQGYLISRPMPESQVADYLRSVARSTR